MVNGGNNTYYQNIISRVLSIGYHMSITVLGAGFVLHMLGWDEVGSVVINVGLLILLATPLARVAASAVIFYFIEGDRKYSVVSLVVFVILLTSIFVGREI